MAVLPTVLLAEQDTVRLIATGHLTEPALAPLADGDDALNVLAELERRTSRRQDVEMPLPAGLRRDELVSAAHGFGWTYVNAAFCYTRPEGSRFNGPERGAWYAAWGPDAAETALAEIAWHLTRELENVGVFENATTYGALLAGFIGPFADLRRDPPAGVLDPDPAVGHPAGQALAARLRAAGVGGVVYPSVRRTGGLCLAAFRTTMVQNVRRGATWRLVWAGEPVPRVEAI